jgi:hypothetical protein
VVLCSGTGRINGGLRNSEFARNGWGFNKRRDVDMSGKRRDGEVASPGSGAQAVRPAPDLDGESVEEFFMRMRRKHGYDVTGEHWTDWWKWRRKEVTSS